MFYPQLFFAVRLCELFVVNESRRDIRNIYSVAMRCVRVSSVQSSTARQLYATAVLCMDIAADDSAALFNWIRVRRCKLVSDQASLGLFWSEVLRCGAFESRCLSNGCMCS